jgi:hypothetical protein
VHGAGRTGRICHQNNADCKCRLWIAKENLLITFQQTFFKGNFRDRKPHLCRQSFQTILAYVG